MNLDNAGARRALQIAMGASLWLTPAVALANPGPAPAAMFLFFAHGVFQLIAASVAYGASAPRQHLQLLALACAFLGLSATGVWEAALIFQAPAALLVLVSTYLGTRRGLRHLGHATVIIAAIVIPVGIYCAQQPWGPFAASSNALKGDGHEAPAGRTPLPALSAPDGGSSPVPAPPR